MFGILEKLLELKAGRGGTVTIMAENKSGIQNKEHRLIETVDINNYLELLKIMSRHYLIVLSVRDTPGNMLTDEIIEKIHDIGFADFSRELWRMYIGVINKGEIVCDALSENSEEPVNYACSIQNTNLLVSSMAWRKGNICRIVLNDKDYAINKRGINLVVYDTYNNRLIDSIVYDAHASKSGVFIRFRKHDIGLFGLWYGHNYGSIVTYFALHNVIESLGYSTVMIKDPLGVGEEVDISTLEKSHALRFAVKHYDIAPLYRISEMDKLSNFCDRFLIGSDQMWRYSLSRPYQQSFFLEFVSDDKIKVAYASSFGAEKYEAPDDYKVEVRKNLRRFSAVSVRDDFSKEICEKEFGILAEQVIDPVFLCPMDKYEELIDEANTEPIGNYFFAYILDPNPQWGRVIGDLTKRTGKKAVVMFDGAKDSQKEIKTLNVDNSEGMEYLTEEDVCIWLSCFKNAEFVVTDSFHGVCFSIIFHRPFIVKKNNTRGGRRFECLLSMVGLESHMVTEEEQVKDKFDDIILNGKIDYAVVDYRLEKEKKKGIEWLKNAIETPKEQIPNIILPDTISSKLNKELCTGCSACMNCCPIGAISLQPDEYGYYRATVDYDKCIGCGNCLNVCPALELPQNNNFKEPELYEFIAADEAVLYASSSGGAFPLLAREAFRRGGAVAGAAWRDDFSVEHIIIDDEKDLGKLQKSKYLQSYVGKVFLDVKERLERGIFVLFSGCPCQVAGLKAFLEKDYENLIMVDLLCGNAPSTYFFQKYVKDDFDETLATYEFRYKEQGWNWDCTTTTTTTGNVIVRRGGKQDSYQRVYHNHVMCPKHCENCKYQNSPRFGDLTIGDFWGIGDKDKTADISRGVSAVLCNNEKSKKFFECIPEESVLIRKNVPLEWLGGNGFVNGGHNFASPKRAAFYKAVKSMPFTEAINYALKPNKGIYPERGLLNYNARAAHFSFDSSVWEEHYVNGVTVLITKQIREKTGQYVTMPLNKMLRKGCSYILKMRFKVKSDSDIINFHVKDSGTRLFQVIYSHKISHDESNWIEINKEFVPDSNIYDEFMMGAAQLCGEGRFLAIDYIDINETCKE